jgi:hypothetical protein
MSAPRPLCHDEPPPGAASRPQHKAEFRLRNGARARGTCRLLDARATGGLHRAGTRASVPVTDFYCGVVPANVWPLGGALVVELEVPRGSYLIASVHTNAGLPGLERLLSRNLVGKPISVATRHELAGRGSYRAEFWHWVHAALVFAVMAFKEHGDGLLDYLRGLRNETHVAAPRAPQPTLADEGLAIGAWCVHG